MSLASKHGLNIYYPTGSNVYEELNFR